MKLYHGTAHRHAPFILDEGIKPRGKTRKSNWTRTVESNPGYVYLTNAYALYFASNAAGDGDKLAVFEVDTDRLLPFDLHPDEDFLEQATRLATPEQQEAQGLARTDKPMEWRTRWYRKRLPGFQPNWEQSLEAMGTATHKGTVPRHALTRMATVEADTYRRLVWAGHDPMICLANYRIVGARYRNFMRLLFNDGGLEDDFWKPADVFDKGVEVKVLDK